MPPAERIAVFDNDGTLWVEHPMYTQLAFALDQVKALAPKHTEWREKPPFKYVLDNNLPALAASGKQGLMELVMATHAGMTTQEFEMIVEDWLATARHIRFKRPYTELVYQPMLELLGYLRANGFKTFIVSGGGIEFMRPWAGKIYTVPPEQVVGSSIKTKYELKNGKPVIVRLPEVDFIDDKAGKPVGINKFIGRLPLAAATLAPYPRELLSTSDQRRLAEATRELRASLLARPDDWASHYNLGNFYFDRKEFPKPWRPSILPPASTPNLSCLWSISPWFMLVWAKVIAPKRPCVRLSGLPRITPSLTLIWACSWRNRAKIRRLKPLFVLP